jgi:thiol-disulfide isomerase/thioredoxin
VSGPWPARRRSTLAGALFALALVAGAASGFLLYHLRHPAGTQHALTAPLPALPPPDEAPTTAGAEGPRRAIPQVLPDFVLPGLDGTPHRLSDWKGRPLIVNFWASWCEPCRREIPLLEELRRSSGGALEVIGVAVDTHDAAQKYAHESGIDYPVLVGEQGGLEAAAAFGIEPVLPFSVFSDRDGRVVTLKVGELHRDEAQFILGRIRALDRHQLGLSEARNEIAAGVRGSKEAAAN